MNVNEIVLGIHDMDGDTLLEKNINFFSVIAKHFENHKEEYAFMITEDTYNFKFSFEISSNHQTIPTIKVEKERYIIK